jgi:dihydrofolate synthase/folylpolyglutamate synthase
MNKVDAESYIYHSYLKAEKYQKYGAKDSDKRCPFFTKDLIRERCVTPCVVVTGSKGKGSVSSMVSQVLQTALNVGLMTSPHLMDICERFAYNGKQISEADFIKQVERIRPSFDELETSIPDDKCVSPMGIQTALALSYFNEKKTQFNVFECGKGAKYDDVNNTLHSYAIINSIFLEHTRELGETLEEIAADKACVITGEQSCVYVAEQKEEVMAVIRERARKYNVPLKVYGTDFRSENIRFTTSGMIFDVVIGKDVYKDICVPLMGEHQARNCALAMAFCKDILGSFDVEKVRRNLLRMNWPGRMEVLSDKPFMMLDACINSECTKNVKSTLEFLGIDEYTVIVGIPDDKDYAGVVKSMSEHAASIILTKSQNKHYVFTEKQQQSLASEGIDTVWTNSVQEAMEKAEKNNHPMVILGTTSVVSEVKIWMNHR